MKKIACLEWTLALVAAFGMCVPTTVMAATPAPSQVVDVALLDGGVLIGQVVDAGGASQAAVPVSLQYQGKSVATPKTNKEGYFSLKGVKAGVYQIATKEGHGVYRLWAPGTAPPTAHKGAMIVTGDEVTRAQFGGSGMLAFLANPWVIAGVVATAVAVPVAIHNSNNDSPSSP